MADDITLEELKERAAVKREEDQANMRKLYKLARDLDFDSYEANLLRNTTEETIRRLAQEHHPRLCSNCIYNMKDHCEVREKEDIFDGCGDYKTIGK